ncbi:MAG: aldehyde dehydrogenase family protein, partial [Myxococcota bacterium]
MRHYVDGRWVPVTDPSEAWTSRSPADQSDVLGTFAESDDAVEQAIASSRKAWPAWDALGLEGRTRHLQALAKAFEARRDEVADLIAREVGKPLWEATGEANALHSKVNFTLADGMAAVADQTLS